MRYILLLLVFTGLSHASEPDLNALYKKCLSYVEADKKLIASLRQQNNRLKELSKNDSSLIDDFTLLESKYKKLTATLKAVESNSTKQKTALNKQLALCQENSKQLMSEYEVLNEKYKKHLTKYAAPWYARWETWAALGIGILIGVPIG